MSETPRDQAESLVTIDDDDNCNEEVHQSRPAPKPGELTPGASDDISTSVVYSYNWFSKTEVDGESYAVCLTCEEEEKAAKAAGRKLLSKGKKKKMLKVPLGTTKRKLLIKYIMFIIHNVQLSSLIWKHITKKSSKRCRVRRRREKF